MPGCRVVTLAVVLLLHLCTSNTVLNATAPGDGTQVSADLAYADGPRHTLDVYAPRQAASAPVVVFFYGGGWETGDKSLYRFVGAALARSGVVAVLPDYRLHPAVQFPAFVQDAAASVAWTRANATRFGGDPRRLFLMGHSAGAHIAALLALDPRYLRAVGMTPQRDLCGVIGLAGPYDFPPAADAAVNAVFGPATIWPQAEPARYVTADAPRMLLLAGSLDRTIDPGNTLRLAARLDAAGATAHAEIFPDITHTAIIAAMADRLRFLAPVQQAVLRFVATPCGR